MRIGVAAARLGDVDGVSFEVVKWHDVLAGMGHDVIFAAGSLKPGQVGRVIPQMHFADPASARVTEAAFDPASDAAQVRAEVDRLAAPLERLLAEWVRQNALDRLIVENAWAIPMHLPLGVALARVARETGIPSVGHHHDYWWERERFAQPVVPELLAQAFPPDMPHVRHASINSLAAAELRRRRGLDSTVIPNVFDFDQPMPVDADTRRRVLRTELGLDDDGLLVLQPTRVVPRKGIELAIELVARLGRPSSVLLITSPAGDEGFEYLVELTRLAEELGVDMRYGPTRFRPTRHLDPTAADPGGAGAPSETAHSLIDAYLAADLVTYPSYREGFGNALVEAIYFGKPVVVNRYAVYEADIRPLGLRFVELDGGLTDEAVADVRALLADPARRATDAEHNLAVGRRHLGYDRLAGSLGALLD